MGHAAPKLLAAKLLAIRQAEGCSQLWMAKLLQVDHRSRICDFERGRLVPGLTAALYYSRIAAVPLESIVDDDINLKTFREQLIEGQEMRGEETRGEIIERVTLFWRE
jgi:transcriptional regulator with XRE-family HTH domain